MVVDVPGRQRWSTAVSRKGEATTVASTAAGLRGPRDAWTMQELNEGDLPRTTMEEKDAFDNAGNEFGAREIDVCVRGYGVS